ncbi:hypothetical protein DDQ41_17330 [Streptomyces spongiicola]|uniref:Uncharacterized protein n=1 Tax=Streptomyces spongiicola TaxID=1690221 RepID=A0ABN5KJE3_9ACTN|nr:hypothetical protein DDQ41_17330 [Streptomyces spongiicola]
MVTAPPTAILTHVERLTSRQQMAVDCVRCARRLGMAGQVWGEVRHRGLLFRLWICAPECPPSLVGGVT